MLRKLTIACFIVLGLLCLLAAFLTAAGLMPRHSQWSDLIALLLAFLFFALAIMEIRAIRREEEANHINQVLFQRELNRRSIGNVHTNRW